MGKKQGFYELIIEVDEAKAVKDYPNYRFNYSNVEEFFEMLEQEVRNVDQYNGKYGYRIVLKKEDDRDVLVRIPRSIHNFLLEKGLNKQRISEVYVEFVDFMTGGAVDESVMDAFLTYYENELEGEIDDE